MTRRDIRRSGQRTDVNDLAANIIAQARFEWQKPTPEDYRVVCFGDSIMGFEPCIFREECYPGRNSNLGSGKRYRKCLRRRNVLRQELLRFFFSPWFEFLLGGVEPGYAREAIGISEMNNTERENQRAMRDDDRHRSCEG